MLPPVADLIAADKPLVAAAAARVLLKLEEALLSRPPGAPQVSRTLPGEDPSFWGVHPEPSPGFLKQVAALLTTQVRPLGYHKVELGFWPSINEDEDEGSLVCVTLALSKPKRG